MAHPRLLLPFLLAGRQVLDGQRDLRSVNTPKSLIVLQAKLFRKKMVCLPGTD